MELLQGIDETKSINLAAKKMKMSYSKAWRIIKNAELELEYPLIVRYVGGIDGGGSTLTPEGKKLVKQYLLFEDNIYNQADQFFKDIFIEKKKGDSSIERDIT